MLHNNTAKPNFSLLFNIYFLKVYSHKRGLISCLLCLQDRSVFHNKVSTRSSVIPKLSPTECTFTNQASYVFAANISGRFNTTNREYHCPLLYKCEIGRCPSSIFFNLFFNFYFIFKLNITFEIYQMNFRGLFFILVLFSVSLLKFSYLFMILNTISGSVPQIF